MVNSIVMMAREHTFTADDVNAAKLRGLTLLSLDETSPFYLEPALRNILAVLSDYSLIVLRTERNSLLVADIKNRAKHVGLQTLDIRTTDKPTLIAIYERLPSNGPRQSDTNAHETSVQVTNQPSSTGIEKITVIAIGIVIGLFVIGKFSHHEGNYQTGTAKQIIYAANNSSVQKAINDDYYTILKMIKRYAEKSAQQEMPYLYSHNERFRYMHEYDLGQYADLSAQTREIFIDDVIAQLHNSYPHLTHDTLYKCLNGLARTDRGSKWGVSTLQCADLDEPD